MTYRQIVREAIRKYGKESQLIIAMEEMSELTKELSKHIRGYDNRAHILEELADCEVMFDQIKEIFEFNDDDVNLEKMKKARRLESKW